VAVKLRDSVRRVDHIGLTVPDADAASAFFVEVLGARLLYRHGPYSSSPTGSSLDRIVMLSLGELKIELLQYDSPTASGRMPRPDEPGGHHLALYVDNLDDAVEAARDSDIAALGQPMDLPGPESGPGARFVFLRTPWGLILELISYPHRAAF
jgi:catechol 2,3-dioxygenase-like lactoylglutathione lyase family enzyme